MECTKKFTSTCLLLILSFFLTSCAETESIQQGVLRDKSYCIQRPILNYTKAGLPRPFYQLHPDTVLTNRFSCQSLNTANAIGLLDLLTKYVHLNMAYKVLPDTEKKVDRVGLLQKINQRINIASLEISAIASELDCEEKRADQFAYYLKEKEGNTENKLVIGSIIVGAAGAILAELLSDDANGKLASNITIGSSIVEAAFGILMLTNKKKIEFRHPRNALRDIWNSPTVSDYYPPSVWYYLTYKDPDSGEKSLVKLLVEKWALFGQITSEKKDSANERQKLYFGKGGEYNSEELKNRADMLDQVESYISLMKQELRELSSEIEKLNHTLIVN